MDRVVLLDVLVALGPADVDGRVELGDRGEVQVLLLGAVALLLVDDRAAVGVAAAVVGVVLAVLAAGGVAALGLGVGVAVLVLAGGVAVALGVAGVDRVVLLDALVTLAQDAGEVERRVELGDRGEVDVLLLGAVVLQLVDDGERPGVTAAGVVALAVLAAGGVAALGRGLGLGVLALRGAVAVALGVAGVDRVVLLDVLVALGAEPRRRSRPGWTG
ncbi:hypothetical protein [Pseudonocardia nigra]|uniref:hypothetical protein n=1 Tax=Pseudonocardia nigra TaxID=1921578 RepID=UPI001C5EB3FD|nr:hypothetical protein [Pseudonocardia nigra]